VVLYRKFRNTDPPALAEVWNEALAGRGSVRLRTSSPLERHTFAKPYFDPAGLIVAEDDGICVGFSHAGFGPNAEETALAFADGVTCLVAVRPSHRRRGLGSELLRQSEAYLRERGAQNLFAGPMSPLNPFYLGLYGGSDLPGFLASDPDAEPFLTRHGYQRVRTALVLQRQLNPPPKVLDPRFAAHRTRFEVRVGPRLAKMPWWQECVFGLVEPLEFLLEEKPGGKPAGRAWVWEMEGFRWRWNQAVVGVLGLRVREDLRRQGLGKFLLAHVLRYVHEQYFELVEMQVPESNEAALSLCRSFGFERVDVGHQYQRQTP
jgi:ribosomal protein S18 acetylase RimI-like enzyme